MKLVSWNVNGVRAVMKKNFLDAFKKMKADVLCLQETKAQDDQVREALTDIKTHHIIPYSAIRKGYSGTTMITRQEPINIAYGIGSDEHDQEGRVIAAEFDDYYLVTVYTPNSGSELLRLEYRQTWDIAFRDYLKSLEKTKPVIVCGDLNVAHQAIDLARPKQNYNKAAGYMQEEIDGFQNLVDAGFVDSFRALHPEKVKYSWWSYRAGARERNVGWRIDYFLGSASLRDAFSKADLLNDVHGSDHCPVSLTLN